jgi:glycosyltransferase involved in cell wall biosynthesis
LFAYPSAYEGFGLPVLEAMACGVPTVTSSTSGLEELAGPAAVVVQPGSDEELQDAIVRIVNDPDLREQMRQAGLRRSQQFGWEQTARRTVEVYERTLGSYRP